MSNAKQWLSRTSLPEFKASNSLIFTGDPADSLVPVSLSELAGLREISRATWSLTALKTEDRLLVSTIQEGSFPVGTGPEVLAPLCSAVSYANPRGRLRLLHTIKQFKPTVWVTTPCAALDFLARLYMEFNIDPFELGIEHIVLVGEIAASGTHKRLADEFEAIVTDLYCDPIFGAALALRSQGQMQCGEPGLLSLASLTEDIVVSTNWQTEENAEIVMELPLLQSFDGLVVRTGQVVAANQSCNTFHHTIGEQVLVRGRWLSLPLMTRALKFIDGAQAWNLLIERGEGTLDRVTLKMGLNREALISNPMWQARIREAISSVTPIAIHIDTYLLTAEDPQPQSLVDDQRQHHLGGCTGLSEHGGWQF